MMDWLVHTLNGFMAKLGLPPQPWQQAPQLSLQFDGDTSCEMIWHGEVLTVTFFVPISFINQNQVLQYLTAQNHVNNQGNLLIGHHWYQDQAVLKITLAANEVTETALEHTFSTLLSVSQKLKVM